MNYTHARTHAQPVTICRHNTGHVHVNGTIEPLLLILAKHCIRPPWWWTLCDPKHVGALFKYFIIFIVSTNYIYLCISWIIYLRISSIIKCLSLMQGANMKILDLCYIIFFLCLFLFWSFVLFILCFVLLCVLFLLFCCLFPISVQVYWPLPPGGYTIAVNKYIISYVMSCYVPSPLTGLLPELLIGEVVRFLRVDCSH